MRNRIITFIAAAVLAVPILARTAMAQTEQLPPPSPIEKDLAARASDVTEVTLGKNMLAFAAKIMNGKDDDDVATRKLIEGLEGQQMSLRQVLHVNVVADRGAVGCGIVLSKDCDFGC